MNKGIGYAISFVCGGVAVGLPLYFIMKNRCEKKIDEEVEKFKEDYKSLHKFPHFEEDEESAVNPPDKRPDTTSHSSIERGPVRVERVAYNKMAANYRKGDILDNTESDDDAAMAGKSAEDILSESEHPMDGSEEGVVIITSEEFEGDETFDDAYLSWYVGDDVLIDQFGDIVENHSELCGDVLSDLRDELKDLNEDRVMYIRNNDLGINYEVDIIAGAYVPDDGEVK